MCCAQSFLVYRFLVLVYWQACPWRSHRRQTGFTPSHLTFLSLQREHATCLTSLDEENILEPVSEYSMLRIGNNVDLYRSAGNLSCSILIQEIA